MSSLFYKHDENSNDLISLEKEKRRVVNASLLYIYLYD